MKRLARERDHNVNSGNTQWCEHSELSRSSSALPDVRTTPGPCRMSALVSRRLPMYETRKCPRARPSERMPCLTGHIRHGLPPLVLMTHYRGLSGRIDNYINRSQSVPCNSTVWREIRVPMANKLSRKPRSEKVGANYSSSPNLHYLPDLPCR